MDASAVSDRTATERADMDMPCATADMRIQIEFHKGMWWDMPCELSSQLLDKYQQNCESAGYIWNWEETREGTWTPDGDTTSINRYVIDFLTMMQTNIDTQRTRRVRFVRIVAEAGS